MKIIYKYLLIMGILLIIIPFFIFNYNVVRLISVLCGIFLVTLFLTKKYKKYKSVLFLVPVLLLIITYALDMGLSYFLKYRPLYASKVVSSSKVETFNSLLFRVHSCDNNLTFDYWYQKKLPCSYETLKEIYINEFLETPAVSYKENKNKFIKISGKISKVVGNSEILLEAYDGEIELNGYVKFNKEKAVRLTGLVINPEKYFIYDEIEVVGLVSDISNNIISLKDVQILDNHLYDNYEVIVTGDYFQNEEMIDVGFYYLGLKSILYKYDENNIYELGYLLSDNRESIGRILKGVIPYKVNDDGDLLYKLEKYNVLVCKNENVYFANKYISNYKNVC